MLQFASAVGCLLLIFGHLRACLVMEDVHLATAPGRPGRTLTECLRRVIGTARRLAVLSRPPRRLSSASSPKHTCTLGPYKMPSARHSGEAEATTPPTCLRWNLCSVTISNIVRLGNGHSAFLTLQSSPTLHTASCTCASACPCPAKQVAPRVFDIEREALQEDARGMRLVADHPCYE
jgi:hypothetical protein